MSNLNDPKRAIELILQKIEEYSTIIISRHRWPDGDAYGSSMGLREILKQHYPEKTILVINEDQSEVGKMFGQEDNQVDDEVYKNALVIVLDTANSARISNSKWNLGDFVIKIDHHPAEGDYGDLVWATNEYAATCEMIVDLVLAFDLYGIHNPTASKYLFAGIVTDTGRFRFSNVTQTTFACASICMADGINTAEIYEALYLEPAKNVHAKGALLSRFSITEHGVAYYIADKDLQLELEITPEAAADYVNELSTLKNCPVWVAFTELTDGSYRIRVRSRRVPLRATAEKWHGGGHEEAVGIVAPNWDTCRAILNDLDKLLTEDTEH